MQSQIRTLWGSLLQNTPKLGDIQGSLLLFGHSWFMRLNANSRADLTRWHSLVSRTERMNIQGPMGLLPICADCVEARHTENITCIFFIFLPSTPPFLLSSLPSHSVSSSLPFLYFFSLYFSCPFSSLPSPLPLQTSRCILTFQWSSKWLDSTW